MCVFIHSAAVQPLQRGLLCTSCVPGSRKKDAAVMRCDGTQRGVLPLPLLLVVGKMLCGRTSCCANARLDVMAAA